MHRWYCSDCNRDRACTVLGTSAQQRVSAPESLQFGKARGEGNHHSELGKVILAEMETEPNELDIRQYAVVNQL